MKVLETGLSGVLVLEPKRFRDARGFFAESWNRQTMADAGLNVDFVQDNLSLSTAPGTIRGLHFQAPPFAQAKLVICAQGGIRDAVVDVRRGSPTYGQSITLDLGFKNGLQLFVPEGFLHGFMTLEPNTVVQYKVTAFYNASSDGAVRWDSCGIDWGLKADPVLSDKDAAAPTFDEFESPFVWEQA